MGRSRCRRTRNTGLHQFGSPRPTRINVGNNIAYGNGEVCLKILTVDANRYTQLSSSQVLTSCSGSSYTCDYPYRSMIA